MTHEHVVTLRRQSGLRQRRVDRLVPNAILSKVEATPHPLSRS
jgi:hypothetical protein